MKEPDILNSNSEKETGQSSQYESIPRSSCVVLELKLC